MLQEQIAAVAELLTGDKFLEIKCPGYIYFFNLSTMKRVPSVSKVVRDLTGNKHIIYFMIELSGNVIEEASQQLLGDIFRVEIKELTSPEGAARIAEKVSERIMSL